MTFKLVLVVFQTDRIKKNKKSLIDESTKKNEAQEILIPGSYTRKLYQGNHRLNWLYFCLTTAQKIQNKNKCNQG